MNENISDSDLFGILSNVERIKKLEPEDAKRELLHLADQFKIRYKYLVGEWAGNKRAKSTWDGKFVSKEEVKNYLDNIS